MLYAAKHLSSLKPVPCHPEQMHRCSWWPSACARRQDTAKIWITVLQEFEVLLLVGAGIGVTPFASVLADLVNRMEAERAYAANPLQACPKSCRPRAL
jgi:hypothetical protein